MPERGFTLLELLVVLTLLSVIMLAMGAALRTIAQTEQRIDQRLSSEDEFRVAMAFMRSTLGRVSARKVTPSTQTGAGPLLFAASPDAVAWVGIMPARYGAGGRHFFRLGLEGGREQADLVIRFLPWVDSNTFPDWSQAEARTLVTQVSSFGIRYTDARETLIPWPSQWPYPERLPDRVVLSVQTAKGPWPELVIPLRAMSAGESGSGEAVIGGS